MQGARIAAISGRGLDFPAVDSMFFPTRSGDASAQAGYTTHGSGDGETAVEDEEVTVVLEIDS